MFTHITFHTHSFVFEPHSYLPELRSSLPAQSPNLGTVMTVGVAGAVSK